MKNQYFGDTRDLFKYDLILELLTHTELKRFTFIPMLTENDDTSYESQTDYQNAKAGLNNKVLVEYLRTRVEAGLRDIRETAGIFDLPKYKDLSILAYMEPFLDEARFQYFQGIPEDSLRKSIILLDPDIGLWVRSSRLEGDKYVRYDEARAVYDGMHAKSVLIIFQYIPPANRVTFFNDTSMKLKEWVTHGRPLYWLSDNQVSFFVMTKDNSLYKDVREILREYGDWYGLLFGEN
jgi:hypothetical protein